MREERGQLVGDQTISDELDFKGTIVGNVKIIKGGKVYLRGNVIGHLTVEDGGRVHIFGNVSRDLTVMAGAKVIHSGVIGGDAINRGGRLYVEPNSKVQGKVKTKAGETHVSPRAQAST